jgi:hypothetical protein
MNVKALLLTTTLLSLATAAWAERGLVKFPGTVNTKDDVGRCFACHRPQAQRDFVFTLERMKDARSSN